MGRSEGAGEEEGWRMRNRGEGGKERLARSEDERLEVVKRRNTKSREGGGMAARFSSAVGDEGLCSYLYVGFKNDVWIITNFSVVLNSNYKSIIKECL